MNSDQRNYNYNTEHLYDGNITPPDPAQPNYDYNYDDDLPSYEEDYAQYPYSGLTDKGPYTFNNYYHK